MTNPPGVRSIASGPLPGDQEVACPARSRFVRVPLLVALAVGAVVTWLAFTSGFAEARPPVDLFADANAGFYELPEDLGAPHKFAVREDGKVILFDEPIMKCTELIALVNDFRRDRDVGTVVAPGRQIGEIRVAASGSTTVAQVCTGSSHLTANGSVTSVIYTAGIVCSVTADELAVDVTLYDPINFIETAIAGPAFNTTSLAAIGTEPIFETSTFKTTSRFIVHFDDRPDGASSITLTETFVVFP